MSYSIFYDKLFVKLSDDKYIFMALAGDNNVYRWNNNYTRQVRSRDWQSLTYVLNGDIIGNLKDVEATCGDDLVRYVERYKDEATEAEIKKRWGYYTALKFYKRSGLTYGNYVGFYKTGIEQAKTIEELAKENIYLRAYHYSDKTDLPILPAIFRTTEEFWDFYYNIYPKYTAQGINIYLTYDNEYSIECFMHNNWLTRKNERNANKKDTSHIDTWYYLKGYGGYFVKFTKRSLLYNYNKNKAFKTVSLAAAKRKVDAVNRRLKAKFGSDTDIQYEVETIKKDLVV